MLKTNLTYVFLNFEDNIESIAIYLIFFCKTETHSHLIVIRSETHLARDNFCSCVVFPTTFLSSISARWIRSIRAEVTFLLQ